MTEKQENMTQGADGLSQPAPDEALSRDEEVASAPFVAGGESRTTEDLASLQARAAKADANWAIYLRTRADLENFRKRVTRERQEAARFASLGLVEKLLPVLDNFEMAISAANQGGDASRDSVLQGVTMVQSQLKGILSEVGVQEIEAAGQVFDPALHEAVAHQEAAEVPEGCVLQQIRKGYRLHDRLVRPASVIVAKKPAA